jgi:hypothetical protein
VFGRLSRRRNGKYKNRAHDNIKIQIILKVIELNSGEDNKAMKIFAVQRPQSPAKSFIILFVYIAVFLFPGG